MARLIDADELKTAMDECIYSDRDRFSTGYAKSFIDNAPTVDAVPVCRCKDCKWFCTDDNNGSCGWRSIPGGVSGEWFCADGERKGGDE